MSEKRAGAAVTGQQGEREALVVPAEAFEVAAEALHDIDCGCDEGPDSTHRAQADAALTAALPYLATQPPRVTPSAEEVAEEQVIRERDDAEEMADRLAAALAPADVIGEHSSANDPWQNALDYATAQPTVQQVREQVAAEIEAQIKILRSVEQNEPAKDFTSGLARAARIARGEKGGE